MSSPATASLLTIPLELRRIIYSYITHEFVARPYPSYVSICVLYPETSYGINMYRFGYQPQHRVMLIGSLRLTCQQVYDETRDLIVFPELSMDLEFQDWPGLEYLDTTAAEAILNSRLTRENVVTLWLNFEFSAKVLFEGRRHGVGKFARRTLERMLGKKKRSEGDVAKLQISRWDCVVTVVRMLEKFSRLRFVGARSALGDPLDVHLGDLLELSGDSLQLERYFRARLK